MTNNTVIYNTIDYTGMCPKEVFDKKSLYLWVHAEVELTREQMQDLFHMWDDDHREWTDLFWYALRHMMHTTILEWVKSDVRIALDSK